MGEFTKYNECCCNGNKVLRSASLTARCDKAIVIAYPTLSTNFVNAISDLTMYIVVPI